MHTLFIDSSSVTDTHSVVVIVQIQARPGLMHDPCCPCFLALPQRSFSPSGPQGGAEHFMRPPASPRTCGVPCFSSFSASMPFPGLLSSSGYWPGLSSEFASPCRPCTDIWMLCSWFSCWTSIVLIPRRLRPPAASFLSHEKWRWVDKVEMASLFLSEVGRKFGLAKYKFISFRVVASLDFT